MTENNQLVDAIYEGWHVYQQGLVKVISPLTPEQLGLQSAPDLRSVGQIAAHMIGARARWFNALMGEGGQEFETLGKWDRRGAKPRTAQELVYGLEATWKGMYAAITRWTEADWQETWPGEYETEPELITRYWVIWHLIEHDLHHGGEISIILGSHGVPALQL